MSGGERIVLGLTPPEEEAIEEALWSGGLRVLASAAEAGELLELVASSNPELVLVSAELPGLDAGSLARLRSLGPRCAGLALDERAEALLERLGLDPIVRPPIESERLVALLAECDKAPVAGAGTARPVVPRAPLGRAGNVVAVLGSKGSPGASELAASFAAVLARSHDVLLVEFDADGGGLAARLGLDAHEGSLLGLARAVAGGAVDPGELLPHWVVGAARGWPSLLLALPDPPRDLPEIAVPALPARILELLTASFPLLVCDVGHRLSAGDGDLAAALHREVALGADVVLLALGTLPAQLHVGLAQLDLLLGDLNLPPEALRIALNGQPGARSPRDTDAGGAITAELASRGLTVDAWIPFDERGLRAALRRSAPIAAASPRGPYGRALAGLVSAILLPDLPRTAPRKRRLRVTAVPGGAAAGAASEEVVLPWRR